MDRRKLKQQYKLNAPSAGIYCITNQVTGRVLLGPSMNIEGILNRHRFNLAHGGHENRQLLQDWCEHGPDNFTFDIVDTIKPSTEPVFNPRAELEELYTIWRAEYLQRGAIFYK